MKLKLDIVKKTKHQELDPYQKEKLKYDIEIAKMEEFIQVTQSKL